MLRQFFGIIWHSVAAAEIKFRRPGGRRKARGSASRYAASEGVDFSAAGPMTAALPNGTRHPMSKSDRRTEVDALAVARGTAHPGDARPWVQR